MRLGIRIKVKWENIQICHLPKIHTGSIHGIWKVNSSSYSSFPLKNFIVESEKKTKTDKIKACTFIYLSVTDWYSELIQPFKVYILAKVVNGFNYFRKKVHLRCLVQNTPLGQPLNVQTWFIVKSSTLFTMRYLLLTEIPIYQ